MGIVKQMVIYEIIMFYVKVNLYVFNMFGEMMLIKDIC